MKHLRWTFDVISPFAYLQSTRLQYFAEYATLELRPVLFAGLLKHWGTKGPAELPSKRLVTYQTVAWHAHHHGIDLSFPASHPFNPLPLLRLSILKNNQLNVVQRLFNFVWVQGRLPQESEHWLALLDELDVDPSALEDPKLKAQLVHNTDQAINEALFGVPTIQCWDSTAPDDVLLFWGFDATAAVEAWMKDDRFFTGESWQQASAVGSGIQRRSS